MSDFNQVCRVVHCRIEDQLLLFIWRMELVEECPWPYRRLRLIIDHIVYTYINLHCLSILCNVFKLVKSIYFQQLKPGRHWSKPVFGRVPFQKEMPHKIVSYSFTILPTSRSASSESLKIRVSLLTVIQRQDTFKLFTSHSSFNCFKQFKNKSCPFPFVYKPPPNCWFTCFSCDASNPDNTCTFSRFIWISCHAPPFPLTKKTPSFALPCDSVSSQQFLSCVSLHRYTRTTAVSPRRQDSRHCAKLRWATTLGGGVRWAGLFSTPPVA